MSVTIDNPPPRVPTGVPSVQIPRRLHPVVRRIARDWRRLTAGRTARRVTDDQRRTLLAVSGGADSSAMLLALAAATGSRKDPDDHHRNRGPIVVAAHVLHDLRDPADADADRAAAAALADSLQVPFLERRVSVDRSRNLEHAARDARYQALADMAREARCQFVATAHHADDQFESIIMALIRGAGPDGLRAIAPRRPLSEAVSLIRPCLNITHEDTVDLCRRCEVPWRLDHTNHDISRLRAALRHGPLAEISRLRPRAAVGGARSASLMRDAAGLVRDRARGVFADRTEWPRDALRAERRIVLGAGLRAAALRLTQGRHADALTAKTVDPVVLAIRDDSTDPRSFDWPGGIRVSVDARSVAVTPAGAGP